MGARSTDLSAQAVRALLLMVRTVIKRKDLVASLMIATVSSAVLIAFKLSNPGQGAEHYYMNRNRTLYRLMQVCYVIIVVSIAFNFRYALGEIVGETFGKTGTHKHT
jgi:hypothetical protein